MSRHIVRDIKKHYHTKVANELFAMGYQWPIPKRRPTNIDSMLSGLPRHHLEMLLALLSTERSERIYRVGVTY